MLRNKVFVALFLKIMALLALLFASFWAIPQAATKQLQNTYLASMVEKHHRLETLQSPRLVLVGGSSMAFGTDSQLLQDSLGIAIQNMATQIVLGSRFMLNEVKSSLREGDRVVVGFEYHISSEGDKEQQLLASDNYPTALQYIDFENTTNKYIEIIKHQISRFRFTIGALLVTQAETEPAITDTVSVFFRNGFNKQGDLLSHLNNPPQLPLQHAELPSNIDESAIVKDLTAFSLWATQHGIQVCYVFPPYSASAYQKNQETIRRIEHEFRQIPNIHFIGTTTDYVFPDTLFYDSVYHLNQAGRQQRTKKMLAWLKNQTFTH